MAGRFPLYTDADIQGPVIKALKRAGWDVVRAIEAFPAKTKDPATSNVPWSWGVCS